MYTEDTISRHNKFFDEVIKELSLQKLDGNILPVAHLLPDAVPFIMALEKVSNVPLIVPKPKTINSRVLERFYKITLLDISRSDIPEDTFVSQVPNKKTVFIDIGGYFATAVEKLSVHLGNNFCGIVEDTENGLQKYLYTGINFPFINVARSPLKENEDFMVGKAIGYSIERVFREHNLILNGMEFGVLGYGKIGRSVAGTTREKGADVSIGDIDPIKLTHALSHGFSTLSRDDLLEQSDIVCIAAGKVVMGEEEFKKLKPGAWVFTVTSSDDSLDLAWLNKNYERVEVSRYVDKYYDGKKYFHLINRGNTINFIHGTTVGDYILLVQAELLVSAYRLMTGDVLPGEQELFDKDRKEICRIWLEHFS